LLEGILAEPQWRATIEMRLHRGWREAMDTRTAKYLKATPLGMAIRRYRSGS
jgi:hypothetical protein